MKLTEDQITTIKSWIESGDDLGKIQNQINESFDINLTYLETRFLLSDLKIELNEDEEEEEEQEPVDEPVDEPSAEIQDSENVSENTEDPEQQETPSGDLEKEETEGAQPTNINVSVDSITQPQCVISGKVTFSDGQLASWWFDQMGQLGLNPDQEGYTPSREDVAVFQVELRKVLAEQGLG
ncbi:MAG: hypothetical protein ACJ0IZ_09525 [Verrucomicrobiales bacterium]